MPYRPSTRKTVVPRNVAESALVYVRGLQYEVVGDRFTRRLSNRFILKAAPSWLVDKSLCTGPGAPVCVCDAPLHGGPGRAGPAGNRPSPSHASVTGRLPRHKSMLDRTRLFTTAPLDARRSLRLGRNIYQSEASLDRLSVAPNRTRSAECQLRTSGSSSSLRCRLTYFTP